MYYISIPVLTKILFYFQLTVFHCSHDDQQDLESDCPTVQRPDLHRETAWESHCKKTEMTCCPRAFRANEVSSGGAGEGGGGRPSSPEYSQRKISGLFEGNMTNPTN